MRALDGFRAGWVVLMSLVWVGSWPCRGAEAPAVEIVRVPGGGLQPQVATGSDGSLHVVYLLGDPAKSDVWYARRPAGQAGFGRPIRVNRVPGRAMALGTVRGAQLALGAGDVPWVIWNGTDRRESVPEGARLWFAAGVPGRGGFAEEQELNAATEHLDGGASVAAGSSGEVWGIWHSSLPGQAGETNRAVFGRRSGDGGQRFGPEKRLDAHAEGACGCCGLKALGRSDGTLAVLYRTASEGGTFRDMALLYGRAEDAGGMRRITLDRWSANVCPMSTSSLAWVGEDLLAAWETRGEVRVARIHGGLGVPERIEIPGGSVSRKHPSLAVDERGGFLLAWVEGTGWARGGNLAWQRFDPRGRPEGALGRREGVPAWGTAAAFASGDRVGLMY